MSLFYRSRGPIPIDPSIVDDLKKMIDQENPIAKIFRMAADRFKESDEKDVKLCLIGRRSRDGRMYNLPTCSEVSSCINCWYVLLIFFNSMK